MASPTNITSPSLESLRKEIESAKAEENQLTGKVQGLMEQLKKLGLNSLDEANTELAALSKEIPDLIKQRDDGIATLRASYQF